MFKVNQGRNGLTGIDIYREQLRKRIDEQKQKQNRQQRTRTEGRPQSDRRGYEQSRPQAAAPTEDREETQQPVNSSATE